MTESITAWLQSVFHDPYRTTTLVSVIPMIEVRGAITVGINLGLDPWIAWVLACAGASVVCPFLLLCLKPILRLLKRIPFFRFLAEDAEERLEKKAQKIRNDAGRGGSLRFEKALGVFLFVAIPLPFTGVWTGSAVAAFLDLDWKYAVPAIVAGNFVAGLLITLLNMILGKYSSWLLPVLCAFVVAGFLYFFLRVAVRFRKKRQKETASYKDVSQRT